MESRGWTFRRPFVYCVSRLIALPWVDVARIRVNVKEQYVKETRTRSNLPNSLRDCVLPPLAVMHEKAYLVPNVTRAERRSLRMARQKSEPRDPGPRLLEYVLPGGWKVLVGRTDTDNDRLRKGRPAITSRIARTNSSGEDFLRT